MGRKRIDQKYENLILHVLYEQDPGTSVGFFEDFFKLGGSRFDPNDKQRVLNIMGGHAGLLEQGLISGLSIRGNNAGQMPVDIRGIALTAAGKKYVEDQRLSARIRTLLTWIATTAVGGFINTLASLAAGSAIGWFLRGRIKP